MSVGSWAITLFGLCSALSLLGSLWQGGRLERIFRLHLATFDWNCPQHITPRFTEAEISEAVQPLRQRLANLEAENAELRAKLAAKQGVE